MKQQIRLWSKPYQNEFVRFKIRFIINVIYYKIGTLLVKVFLDIKGGKPEKLKTFNFYKHTLKFKMPKA